MLGEMEGIVNMEKTLFMDASTRRIPINGSVELLPLCNMNCDMCYVRLSKTEMEKKGGLTTISHWLSIARQMQKSGVLFLLLTGGEPLMYPDFKQLYLELLNLGMILTINTNGTLIDEAWAEFFGKHKPRRINITLYGADEQAYSTLCHYPGGYDKVLKAVQLLKEQNVDVKLSSSITKANQQDVERMAAIGDELGVPVRMDTYMMPAIREREKPYDQQSRLDPILAARARITALKCEMKEELFSNFAKEAVNRVDTTEEIETVPGKMSCFAGKCSFTINWQGMMRPCVILHEPEISVFEVGFEEAWRYIAEETERIWLNAKCSSCRLRSLCRTCAASALLEEGRYDAVPEYMCQYAKESYRLLCKEINMDKD